MTEPPAVAICNATRSPIHAVLYKKRLYDAVHLFCECNEYTKVANMTAVRGETKR